MQRLVFRVRWMVLFFLVCGQEPGGAQSDADYELPPIRYSATTPSNRVEQIEARLAVKQIDFYSAGPGEILPRLLDAFDISRDTQVLVFSKTSLQRGLIDPGHPRALYFSEDAYVGVVPGGLIECAVADDALGLVFYQFDPSLPEAKKHFVRSEQCLSCHASARTDHWPGLVLRSVFPDRTGDPVTSAGGFTVTHETAISNRWGGWYVTGQHGKVNHMGNATVEKIVDGNALLSTRKTQNIRDLRRFSDTSGYLRGDSDIVALMVLEHQVGMHNSLAQGALRTRKWIEYERALLRPLGRTAVGEPGGTAARVIESEAAKIVEQLLFCHEASLPAGGISGAGDFERGFLRNRRADREGRSLKDFDLKRRLFRHPCSYMIYSRAFAALPPELKSAVYRNLKAVLAKDDPDEKFAHLDAADRSAILEIVRQTQRDLPPGW